MKVCYLLLLIVTAGLVWEAKSQSCHLRNIEACMAGFVVFGRNPRAAIPIDDAGLDKQCADIREARECANNYTSKCASPMMKEVFRSYRQRSEKTIEQFCSRDGELRKNFLKYASCLREVAGSYEFKACVSDVKATLDMVNEDLQEPFELACCAYSRFLHCNSKNIEERCGTDAVEYGTFLIQSNGVANMFGRACGCVDFGSEECKNILPPPGTKPLGRQSESVVARIFSTFINF